MDTNEVHLIRFLEGWYRIDIHSKMYAKSKGLSYTALSVLNCIHKSRGTILTQKAICDRTNYPKQTVNSIIINFQKDNILTLCDSPDDGRTKQILLTEDGKKYCDAIFADIYRAEKAAMDRLSPKEREDLGKLIQLYASVYEEELHIL